MTPAARLTIEQHERVLLLTIDNPGQRNALSPDIYRTGAATLLAASTDPAIGAIILTGAGEHFCSGGNLNRLRANREKHPAAQRDSVNLLNHFILALRGCHKPVIAAVEGNAAGAGCALALGCDLIVAADNARFIMAYVKVGLSPDGGASAFLARALPPQLAMELLLDGAPISAERLHQLGVVNKIVAAGEVLNQAKDWATQLANGPQAAQARIKQLVHRAYDTELANQLLLERDGMVKGVHHPEAGEGIAAFLEKRKPKFVG